MVTVAREDIIPISQFNYAWRITDERWDALPEDVLADIQPLGAGPSERIHQMTKEFSAGPWVPNLTNFGLSTYCVLLYDEATLDTISEWLGSLPVKDTEVVYVSWASDIAAVMKWETFRTHWDSLWYLEDLEVFDDSKNWALMFNHEEFGYFLERGKSSEYSMDDVMKAYAGERLRLANRAPKG